MINLTNWWCGYKPNRVYNATVYVGGGAYFTLTRHYDAAGKSEASKHANDDIFTARAGLINSFRISEQMQISLDLRASGLGGTKAAHAGTRKDLPFRLTLASPTTSRNATGQHPSFPSAPSPRTATPSAPVLLPPMPASPTSSVSSATASTVRLKPS